MGTTVEQSHVSGVGGAAGYAGSNGGSFGGRNGGGGQGNEQAPLVDSYQLGLWAFLGTLSMLFAGFTSAYLVRSAGSDWRPVALPPVLWLNTALLLVSSVTIELGRASIRRGKANSIRAWMLASTILGFAFLAGQLLAWRQLANQGIFLPSNPHASFFYMLTGTHAVHLLGGLLALLYVLRRVGSPHWTAEELRPFSLCATYWHFVDGLWLYLFFLLFAW